MKHVPNALSFARIAITPVFLVLLLSGTLLTLVLALVLFIFGAVSDWLDGEIARRYDVGSRFGQFLDPLADKVLVLGAFLALLFLPPDELGRQLQAGWWWVPVLVIALRDVAVTALRSWNERRGRSIQTKYAAKVKTGVQLTFLIAIQAFLIFGRFTRFDGFLGEVGGWANWILYGPLPDILLVLTALLTLWTGALYFRPAASKPVAPSQTSPPPPV